MFKTPVSAGSMWIWLMVYSFELMNLWYPLVIRGFPENPPFTSMIWRMLEISPKNPSGKMIHQGEAWPVAGGEFTMAQQKDQRNYEYLSVKKDWILIYNMFNMLSSIKKCFALIFIYISLSICLYLTTGSINSATELARAPARTSGWLLGPPHESLGQRWPRSELHLWVFTEDENGRFTGFTLW